MQGPTKHPGTPRGAAPAAAGKGFTLIELLARQPICLDAAQRRRKPRRRLAQTAFTLIELLVVIAIISLLVSILLPSLQQASKLAESVVCQSNLRAICIAAIMYPNDYDGWAMAAQPGQSSSGATSWWGGYYYQVLADKNYVGTRNVFLCPTEPAGQATNDYAGFANVGYGVNYWTFGVGFLKYAYPQRTDTISSFGNDHALIYLADSTRRALQADLATYIQRAAYPDCGPGWWYPVHTRHPNNTGNVVYHDGHGENLDAAEIWSSTHWLPHQRAGGGLSGRP